MAVRKYPTTAEDRRHMVFLHLLHAVRHLTVPAGVVRDTSVRESVQAGRQAQGPTTPETAVRPEARRTVVTAALPAATARLRGAAATARLQGAAVTARLRGAAVHTAEALRMAADHAAAGAAGTAVPADLMEDEDKR